MTRRFWVTLSVLSSFLISCAQPATAPELPHSVSPGWQLSAMREPATGMWEWSYSGPGKARVRIWSIRASAEGLSRVQNWRAEANTVVFSSDRYFAAVNWMGVDPAQAGSLVRAIELAIGIQL